VSGGPKYRDEEWLREQYVERGLSGREVAEQIGCAHGTIYRWLDTHGIETRSQSIERTDKRLKNAEWLRAEYKDKGRDAESISEQLDCGVRTVYKWLNRLDILTASKMPERSRSRIEDGDWLRAAYKEKGRTSVDIADELGCSHPTVLKWLDNHGIEARTSGFRVGEENTRWQGGSVPYGPGWSEPKRRAVRERDGHTCQDPHCSVSQDEHLADHGERLHVHHLHKARDVDNPEERNAKKNLITLCRNCHRRWEKIADAGLVPQLE